MQWEAALSMQPTAPGATGTCLGSSAPLPASVPRQSTVLTAWARLGAGRADQRLLETSRPETVDISSGGVRPVRFSAGFQQELTITKGLAVGIEAKKLG